MVRRLFPSAGLIAFVAVLLPGGVSAQSTDDVARETQRLRVQIDQERKSIAQDSARQAEWRSQSKARLASMRSEALRLTRERDSLRQVLDRASRPKPPAPPPVTPAAARKKAFSDALAREIEKTIPLLSQELDGGLELRDQWGRLVKGLRAGTDDPAEAMARFLDDLSERIDLGSRIVARPGSYTDAAGRALRGTFIDIGGGLQVFVDRDGEKAALRTRGESAMRDVANPVLVASLVDASRILNGEREPGWIFVPAKGAAK